MYSESPWHRGTFAASAVDPTRTFLATRGTRGSGRVSPWLGPTLLRDVTGNCTNSTGGK